MKFKKVISIVLVLFIMIGTIQINLNCESSLIIFANAIISKKEIKSIEIVNTPNKINYYYEVDGYYNECYVEDNNGTTELISYFRYDLEKYGIKIKVNYSDGTSVVSENPFDIDGEPINIIGQSDGETWDIGKHRVTVEFMDKRAYFDIEIIENPVESIEIVRLPDRTKYYEGVNGYWGYNYDYEYDEYGELKYDNNGYPIMTKKEYFNYSLEVNGMELKYTFKNGKVEYGNYYFFERNSIECDQSDNVPWSYGNHTVTVTIMGHSATYEIEILENPVIDIEFVKLNLKNSYIKNELFDICGSDFKVTYKSGQSETLTIKRENVNADYMGGNINSEEWSLEYEQVDNSTNYVFKYMGKTAEFSTKTNDNKITDFKFLSIPKGQYGEGADIEFKFSDGLKLNTNIKSVYIGYGDLVKNGRGEGGHILTNDGIFEVEYFFYNIFSTDKACIKMKFNGKNFTVDNFAADLMALMYKSSSLSFWFRGFSDNSGSLKFDGVSTKENIDFIVIASKELVECFDDKDVVAEYASCEEIRKMVSSVFEVKKFDITLSDEYNKESDLYMFDGGYGEDLAQSEFDIKNKGDLTYIKETRPLYNGELAQFYTVFNKSGKCTYIGTSPKDNVFDTKVGDVNRDGKINSADALLILQHSVGLITLYGNDLVCADVNKDKAVNSSDALRILQYATGVIGSL